MRDRMKMTKTQARRRLDEAYAKCAKVWWTRGAGHLTAADAGKLFKAMAEIERCANKLK